MYAADGARPRREPPHLRAHRARRTAIYESTNGGAHLDSSARAGTDELHGATDLVMDPQNPKNLWASFWGDGIYRSTDGGATWTSAWATCRRATSSRAAPASRSASRHPAGAGAPTLYTGFDYFDLSDAYHAARSLQEHGRRHPLDGAPATGSGTDSILGYCGTSASTTTR